MSAEERLATERKKFRKERPQGFYAKPATKRNGELNLFIWNCKFPGVANTIWADGTYNVILEFPPDYPKNPPTAKFSPPIYHVNVYDDGLVCLSLLDANQDWKSTVDVKTILISLQMLLNSPNIESPANPTAGMWYGENKAKYNENVKISIKSMKN
eukprot:NODE_206_length_12919_cov_0.381357.p10 type:complete len:156 gc:universal NODE_206_length_12919_cov_0.381357:1497-1964(+)